MTFTVQIGQSPFNPVRSFLAVACGTEQITLRTDPRTAWKPLPATQIKEARTNAG